MRGTSIHNLAETIGHSDTDPSAQLFDVSIVHQIAFQREDAMRLQSMAFAGSQLFRVRNAGESPTAVRVLALVLSGDLMANTPLDFITNHLDVRLDLLFLVSGQPLPAVIPDHDIMFFAGSTTSEVELRLMGRLFATWPRPALNNPVFQRALARDALATLLAEVPNICSPSAVPVDREQLVRLVSAGVTLDDLLPGQHYPVLLRPHDSHAGIGLEKIESEMELDAYLRLSTAQSFYLTAFIDYRSSNGLFEKYRIAFIDREPHLCHMAASEHWMVHYLNAGMTENAGKRLREAQAMSEFRTGFAARHHQAFAALHECLPFDYYLIDCAELPDGRLVVFEADTAAIVHLMDPADLFPYKHEHMPNAFSKFEAMLRRRAEPRPQEKARHLNISTEHPAQL